MTDLIEKEYRELLREYFLHILSELEITAGSQHILICLERIKGADSGVDICGNMDQAEIITVLEVILGQLDPAEDKGASKTRH